MIHTHSAADEVFVRLSLNILHWTGKVPVVATKLKKGPLQYSTCDVLVRTTDQLAGSGWISTAVNKHES